MAATSQARVAFVFGLLLGLGCFGGDGGGGAGGGGAGGAGTTQDGGVHDGGAGRDGGHSSTRDAGAGVPAVAECPERVAPTSGSTLATSTTSGQPPDCGGGLTCGGLCCPALSTDGCAPEPGTCYEAHGICSGSPNCGSFCCASGSQCTSGGCVVAGTLPTCPTFAPKSCGSACCPANAPCNGSGCGCPPEAPTSCPGGACCAGACAAAAGSCESCAGDAPVACAEGCCQAGAACDAGRCSCPAGATECGACCCPEGSSCANGSRCLTCPADHPQLCGSVCCASDQDCVRGACQERGARDAATSACLGTRSACASDPACCSRKCISGQCHASQGEPNVPAGPCASDDDCVSGSCKDGQCICLVAGSHVPDTSSGAKQCCSTLESDGVCGCAAAFPSGDPANTPCLSDTDCCGGLCGPGVGGGGGRCQCDPSGAPCASPSKCCNGWCNGGTCG